MREDLKIGRIKRQKAERIHVYCSPETVAWLNERATKNGTNRSIEVERLVDAARAPKAPAPAPRRRGVV